ncbi:MAG: hypothetical protein NTZ33_08245 [Bacteroidetes bacterium]|nr:hypothetical protein [Bacteroidota bacterium]
MKTSAIKLLLSRGMKTLLIILLFSTAEYHISFAQLKYDTKAIINDTSYYKKMSIDRICQNKILLQDFAFFKIDSKVYMNTLDYTKNDSLYKAFILARSAYPELNDVVIKLKFRRLHKSTMESYPSVSLFKSKHKRIYNIYINKNIKRNGISYKDLSFSMLIGWYSHEIAHILDYKDRTNIGMLFYGLRYITFNNYKRKAEYIADSTAIHHCLGCELIEGVQLCMDTDKIKKAYKRKLIKFYMSPAELYEITKRKSCISMSSH